MVLCLDSDALERLRRSAIRGFFGFASAQPIAKAEAETLLSGIDMPDVGGCLRPFCFALKQLLKKYIAGN